MEKVLVIAKEYPEYYNKEMYIAWTRVDRKGRIWYYLTKDKRKIGIADLYLGESQIQIL